MRSSQAKNNKCKIYIYVLFLLDTNCIFLDSDATTAIEQHWPAPLWGYNQLTSVHAFWTHKKKAPSTTKHVHQSNNVSVTNPKCKIESKNCTLKGYPMKESVFSKTNNYFFFSFSLFWIANLWQLSNKICTRRHLITCRQLSQETK